MTDTTRTPTAIDAIANRHHERTAQLSPITATYLGVPGADDQLDDFSPAGYEQHAALARETLAALEQEQPADDVDKVTVAAMRERLGLALEVDAAGLNLMSLNVIASPMQEMRDILDLMPTDTEEQVATIGRRLEAMPRALDQWFESLHAAATKGDVAARRQVEACIKQTQDHTAGDGYFANLAKEHPGLKDQAGVAAAAYRRAGERLREEILPKAPEQDAVGRERYPLYSRQFLGAQIDLEETYAWGQEELARITGEMRKVAEQIKPGASVKEAMTALEQDPRYQLHGTDALQQWMQTKADEAIRELADVHFDIPEPVRTIECKIAPTQSGGIYYTGPSEDFSRPGRMWWSVPKGVEDFGTWRELTTVYHEGVPGHHLQVAQTMYRSGLLNNWRRMDAWTSGHGEGWALYAERLMDELGYLDDPGDKMGMYDGQSLRAARVVLDIGIHCGFDAPAEVGGGAWDYDKAWRFLTAHADMAEGFLRFELDRYLGWPGQAPAYKIGERLWLQLRDQVREREGEQFDLKAFHRRALDIGGVGLDTLREAVLGEL
ncbi:DUF885 domain-containing protein [Calidifontibacter sp. DB0510]|uniref:DUF885 domain-containing protein n=1 Tax=Metallococcus carri TaxID=1656884 RepID=A0A967E8X4_9MICO|nr:DUF885 domain-containing protein [Metallococcus carri]NHN54630.1 DUF885 domain-containing protein [Metallococcus carri]NOP36531.1 DUF885 domain-containing protein [Calidifontibacter sp. DB2511S]